MINNRLLTVFLVITIVASTLPPIAVTAATESPISAKTVTGAAIPLPSQAEQSYLNVLSKYAESFPVSPKAHAFLVMTKEKTWVVATDKKPKAGIATVKGTAITASATSESSLGVMFASDVSIRTQGQSASITEVRNNPSKYAFELVEITANYRQYPYTVEASDKLPSQQAELGVLTTGRFVGTDLINPNERFGVSPGKTGRWATLNLSSQKLGEKRFSDLAWKLWAGGKQLLVYGGSQQFAMNGTTSVSALVLTRPLSVQGMPGKPPGEPLLYLVDSNPKSKTISDVSQIHARGSDLKGDVVTVDAQVFGARTSSKEFLLSVAKCAPESVAVPVTPPGCVPVVTDAVVHTGVLYSQKATSDSDFVGFVGLSNHQQSKVTKPIRGSYRVTGRVVSSSKISPSLPEGYVIVVYDMERKGALRVSATDTTRKFGNKLVAVVERQLKGIKPDHTASSPTKKTGTSTEPAWDNADGDWEIRIRDGRLNTNEITAGEKVRASAKLKNTGDDPLKIRPHLRVRGEVVKKKTVVVPAHSSTRVTFTYTFSEAGVYVVEVGPKTAGVVTVNPNGNSPSTKTKNPEQATSQRTTTALEGFGEIQAPTPGFGIPAAMIAFLTTLLWLRLKSNKE